MPRPSRRSTRSPRCAPSNRTRRGGPPAVEWEDRSPSRPPSPCRSGPCGSRRGRRSRRSRPGCRDAVGSSTAGSIEDVDPPGSRVEASVDAVLAGEPEDAAPVEGGRVEVGVATPLREGMYRGLLRGRIHADDRVPSAVGDPRGPVRADDHAVGARSRAQGDVARRPRGGIEPAQRSGVLGRIPDASVRRGSDVVRMGARRDAVLPDRGLFRRRRHRSGGQGQDEEDGQPTSLLHGLPFPELPSRLGARRRLREGAAECDA